MKLGDKVTLLRHAETALLLHLYEGRTWTVLNTDHVTGLVAVFTNPPSGAVVKVLPGYVLATVPKEQKGV